MRYAILATEVQDNPAMRTFLHLFLVSVLFMWPLSAKAGDKESTSLVVSGRVDEETLGSAIPKALIQAYDLSPDGSRLALFVVSGSLIQAPSWIVIADAKSSKVLSQARWGHNKFYEQGYSPQVAFTPDAKLLVVKDDEKVCILETATLNIVSTVDAEEDSKFKVPAGLLMASQTNVFAISFANGRAVRDYLDKRMIHTVMIDASSGSRVSSWDADDIPFSVSPNAKFVAMSDHDTAGPVMSAAIVDSTTGKKVALLSAGYRYTKSVSNGAFGTRIIARFINDDEVIVAPDGNKDQSGHDVGGSMKVVRIKDARVVQEIEPERFGPTGEIAVSADQSRLVAISRYLAPIYYRHEHWRIPEDSNPQLLVMSGRRKLRLDTRMQLSELPTLRMESLFDSSHLRISANGSIVAIAQYYGITLLSVR